jgi:chemotaxis response regulator CheB
MTIQVILADDQPLVRAGLRRLLEQTPDIDVPARPEPEPRRYSSPGTPAPTWSS